MTAIAPAPARSRTGRRVVLWVGVAVIVSLLVAWLWAAHNPSLASAGISWQSEAFVESDPPAADDEKPSWVVWDQQEGAWASVVVMNDRPYPVTLSPVSQTPAVQVQIAPFDPNSPEDIRPQHLEATEHLKVQPGGYAVVSMRVSDRCMGMEAHSSMGSDRATLNVSTFGLSSRLDVQFPATYWAGTTTGHPADPTCPTP